MRPRTAAKLALGAVLVAVGLFGGSSDASGQIIAQPGPNDYCAESSPDGRRPPLARAFINVAIQGEGTVSAGMWGTGADCVMTRPSICPPNCSLDVMTVCEFHCSHNHTSPYPWTVQLTGQGQGTTPHLVGWVGNCQPIAAAPRSSCVVRMNTHQNVTARFANQPDQAAPSPPAVNASPGKYDVTLSWTPSQDDQWVGGYDVFKNGAREARVGPGTTSLRVFNLLCQTTYRFRIEAFDTANSASSSEITTRTGACTATGGPRPNTVIHTAQIRRRTAYFHWGHGRVRATRYQCKLDRSRWSRCRPGKTYRNLRRGWHRFYVRAGNGNGWDPTPATRRFRIR
jgi:hypothetical protein